MGEAKQRRERGTVPGVSLPLFRSRPGLGRYRGLDDEASLVQGRVWHACWTQDQIHWAYAGHAAEAADGLVRRFRIASTMCRFPLYGREGPDSCPDFDHFGAGAVALQRMLVQEAGDKILLLPAWPADWDVDFKLHLTGGAVLTGTVKDGKLT